MYLLLFFSAFNRSTSKQNVIDIIISYLLKSIEFWSRNPLTNTHIQKFYFFKVKTKNLFHLHSQVSRHKVSDVEEAMNLLLATRSCFRHTALDHVQKITMLQARKRHEILATVNINILVIT